MSDETQSPGRTQGETAPPALPATSPPAVVLPEPGDLIDNKYRVISVLGAGAMGIVYRGRDERLERDVALKLIRPSWAHNERIQHVFVSEARAMARVSHPNVVEIYDFGWSGQFPFFAMQFIEGVDLERWLEERVDLLAVDEALGVLDRVCRGVAAIHASGAVHRDLKPSNIIVGNAFQVAVADLGLAQVLSAATGEGMRIGSPGFMAPEMIAGEALVGELLPRIDIYALGAIAYEMLAQAPVFSGDNVDEVLEAQRLGKFIPLCDIRPELPAAFDAVLGRALSLDPRARQSTVEGFRRELQSARHDLLAKPKGRRVAVIDDSPADLELLAKILRERLPEIVVETHLDPHAALLAFSRDPPALIVTDLRMDTMDGSQLVAAIRKTAMFNHIPIVVVSADGSSREWRALRETGADGFLLKPVDAVPLTALVASLLESPMRVRGGKR